MKTQNKDSKKTQGRGEWGGVNSVSGVGLGGAFT